MLKILKRFWSVRRFDCGHSFRKGTPIHIYGQKFKPDPATFSKEYCPPCLAEMAARCWNCGRPIFPGEAVTHYAVKDPVACSRAQVPKEDMVFYDGYPIGCIWCAEMGAADVCAYWVVPGKVDTSRNPIEDYAQ